jgi:hypothetical protein
MPRVAAVAIDAAEWWYVERLMDQGRLPNLAAVRARSASFPLRSPMAYRSELSWARFLSGQEPFDARNWAASMTFDPATYTLASTAASRARPFYAFGPGTKVIALDLIHCALADDVDGPQVVAWGSHSPQYPRSSRPAGLLTEIDERFGLNPVFENDSFPAWYDPEYLDVFGRGSVTAVDRRAEIGTWLLEEHPDWELFLMCISEVHTGSHLLWHGVDEASPLHGTSTSDQAGRAMDDILIAADRAIGRIVAALPEDASLLVFAFHGAMPADDLLCTVLLPELLLRHHTGRALLASPDTAQWRAEGCPPVLPPADYPWGEYLVDQFADGPKQQVRRALRRRMSRATFERLRGLAGRTPTESPARLPRPIPPESLDPLAELARFEQPIDYQVAAWYRRHWPSMRSFALPTFADGHVRLNLRGRERDGLVAIEDYTSACDEVVRLLADCRDARTGAPVLQDVIRVRQDDPLDPDGPESDLLVIWDAPSDAVEHPTLGVIGPFPHLRTSHHTNHGFALVSGPGVEPGAFEERSTVDLTATVLDLLGRSADDVVGRSLLPVRAR